MIRHKGIVTHTNEFSFLRHDLFVHFLGGATWDATFIRKKKKIFPANIRLFPVHCKSKLFCIFGHDYIDRKQIICRRKHIFSVSFGCLPESVHGEQSKSPRHPPSS